MTTMIPKSFKFECPSCGQHISAMMPDAGTAGACPTCGSQFVVPNPTPSSESSGLGSAGPQRSRPFIPIVVGAAVLVMALAALALYTSGRFGIRKVQSLSVPSSSVDAEYTRCGSGSDATSHRCRRCSAHYPSTRYSVYCWIKVLRNLERSNRSWHRRTLGRSCQIHNIPS